LAQDTDLSLVINPTTGAASIRNDTGGVINIDGYLLTSSQNVFNPLGWLSLTDNGTSGWAEGPAAANRLGEANLLSSLNVGGGALVALGTPYLPFTATQIGQLEPSLTFQYHVAGGASFAGDVVFSPQNNVVLTVNPTTGFASLQNQSEFNINIDGLLITSTAGVLNPTGWNGLAESGVGGWTMGAAETNRLGEGNLLGSTPMAASGAPIGIGFAVDPAMLTDETDLVFEYHIAGGGSVVGGVEFTVAAVDPVDGDYNGDGTVNAADYTVWRNHLGQAFTLTGENPSASTPGIVDNEDYNFWKSRFGATSGSGSGGAGGGELSSYAVPEPGSGLIYCICGLGVVGGGQARYGRRRSW
jgi:hypothetical protein